MILVLTEERPMAEVKSEKEKKKQGGPVWELICAQELAIMKEVDALRISRKPEIIGALFEDTLRAFLARLMPSFISIVPGFIVKNDGKPSSHFDAILIDNTFPYLASIGQHRFVMQSSVLAAIELTTVINKKKLISILKKDAEITNISRNLYGSDGVNEGIGFYALGVDSTVAGVTLKQEFLKKRPNGHLYVLRGNRGQPGYHCWMEEQTHKNLAPYFRETVSPLADLVSMHLQDNLYTLSGRIRDAHAVGELMNNHIHWGTIDMQKKNR